MKDYGGSEEFTATCVRAQVTPAMLAVFFFSDTGTKREDAVRNMEKKIHVTDCPAFAAALKQAMKDGLLERTQRGYYKYIGE